VLDRDAKTMGVKDQFARNLRKLLEQRGPNAVSHTARQLQISRRQLQRYLAAEQMPEMATVARIARHFRVSEQSLFVETDDPGRLEFDGLHKHVRQIYQGMAEHIAPLASGYYHTWFWTPKNPDVVVGALTAVKTVAGLSTFRRLTASAEPKGSRYSYLKGDQSGVVTRNLRYLYFIASSAVEPREPSLLALGEATTSLQMYTGTGTVLTQHGPTIVSAALVAVPQEMKLRTALTYTRAFSINDGKIDPQIPIILRETFAESTLPRVIP
jgi:transcriptional regulator with XRE-family HTH domain